MRYFRDEILKGFKQIPAISQPGNMVIIGSNAQAVFTGAYPTDVFLAAAEYGKGRVFVGAHNVYYNWLKNKNGGLEGQFIASVKKWLTKGVGADDTNILDLSKANESTDFDKYRLCLWKDNQNLSDEAANKLKEFIANGGALFAGITPWAFLTYGIVLDDMLIYRFFKDNFGIVFTKNFCFMQPKVPVENNHAGFSNLSNAIQFMSGEDKKIFNIYKEILDGFTTLPVTGSPGTMIISDKRAQAVFTVGNDNDVFIAAAEYGNGRVFVSTHNCYYEWLRGKNGGLEGEFIASVKSWLTKGAGADGSKTIDVSKVNEKTVLDSVRLCLWHDDQNLTDVVADKLKEYVQDGGALFVALTPWKLLETKVKSLNDLTMYGFFKNNFGIEFTTKKITVQSRIPVSSNLSNNINSKYADEEPGNFLDCCNFIDSYLAFMIRNNIYDLKIFRRVKYTLEEEIKQNKWNVTPTEKTPIKTAIDKAVVKLLCHCFIGLGVKAPSINEFPKDFVVLPELKQNIQIKISAAFEERVSTGYYLPAGVQMSVKVTKGDFKNWNILVGAHTDVYHESVGDYPRWPVCFVAKPLKSVTDFVSPFGGLVYFESPQKSELEVTLSNVVETPYFDVTKPEYSTDWINMRQKAGLWAELAGKHIILTIPSSSIRNLNDAKAVTDFWDEIVKAYHELRGTIPTNQKRERVVSDIKPSAGYMHNLYPIVTHLDVVISGSDSNILDVQKMRKNGNWGLFHEIGHNMQRREWTFDGSGEVTCNIFTLYAMVNIIKQKLLEIQKITVFKGLFKSYFAKQPTYSDWQSNGGMALMMFVQLLKDFGFETMKSFFTKYESDMNNNRDLLPKDNQEKIDQWVIRYSKLTGYNIKPQFEMWGLPVSETVNDKLKDLKKTYNPVDEKDPNKFFTHVFQGV